MYESDEQGTCGGFRMIARLLCALWAALLGPVRGVRRLDARISAIRRMLAATLRAGCYLNGSSDCFCVSYRIGG